MATTKISAFRVCTNCVMDTTDAKIVFDEKGVCDHCNTFYKEILPNWHTGESGKQELDRLVTAIKREGAGKDFDCIIGMSGGFDSTYLVYLAKVKLGLRPLIFHVDTGWHTPESIHNVQKIVSALSLELHTEVIDWEEMRDLQLAFFKAGVPHIDAPQDHACFATMYKFASDYDVKYILTGGNYSTECIRNPIAWMYYQSDSRQLLDIHRRFGTIPLKKFPLTNILWHKVYLPYVKRVQVVRPLDYIHYIKEEAVRFMEENFGYLRYPQKHFESRFTRFYEGYWLYKKFGYDTRKVQFSSLILTGQMTRDEALVLLKEPPLDEVTVKREFEAVAQKLDITVSELKRYMEIPNKSYHDYKSQEAIYRVGAKVMRLFGLTLGGKR